jgi:hypothetical protein
MPLTVGEAEVDLEKAVALEQEIRGELDQVQARLVEAEKTAGDRCLTARREGNSKQIEKINSEVLKLRQQRDVALSTHTAAREAIKAARCEINMARGRDLRAQAAAFMEEAGKRQQKTNELLAALFEHEEIRYLQEPQTRGGACLEGTIAESKTQKLAQEAAAHIRQAEITENQIVRVEPDPPRDGHKSGAVDIKG